MSRRFEKWNSERPRRPAAEIGCLLARDRFWRDPQLRLIGTHPAWPDAAYLLDTSEELAHGLVLVLSRLPAASRRDFADRFYDARTGDGGWVHSDARTTLRVAADIALLVVDVIDRPELRTERSMDLLQGAAQGDDLTRTPEPAVGELQKMVARIRLEVAFDDPADARGAAALALAEVLDPASDFVGLKEVIARSAWAAVELWEPPRVLSFLLEVERLLADA